MPPTVTATAWLLVFESDRLPVPLRPPSVADVRPANDSDPDWMSTVLICRAKALAIRTVPASSRVLPENVLPVPESTSTPAPAFVSPSFRVPTPPMASTRLPVNVFVPLARLIVSTESAVVLELPMWVVEVFEVKLANCWLNPARSSVPAVLTAMAPVVTRRLSPPANRRMPESTVVPPV